MTSFAGRSVDGQIAVITGATRGIGREIARLLAAEGATIVVVGRTARGSEHQLAGSVEDAVDELVAGGATAFGIRANLTDADDTQSIVDQTLEEFGRCDILVNNAAYQSNGPMLGQPWHRMERALRVQVVAPHQLCQGFLPGMLERGSGSIINVSTGASQKVSLDLGLYSTSKLAMERWSEYLDFEIKGRGVSVNTLRVNAAVATEGWIYIAETQGLEVALGGNVEALPMTAESAASFVPWMLAQPADWSGHTLNFEDITALGGPTVELFDASIPHRPSPQT